MNPLGDAERDTVGTVAEGYEAFEAGHWQLAGELLSDAAGRVAEGAGELWFDAALAYKFAGNWPRAYATGRTAIGFVPRGRGEPAFWNLGIAATMLREWAVARDCWAGFGLDLPPGDGPIHEDLGPVCIRLGDVGEVVWARRLCPARARVISVPFDTSRRFGEVLVHDGAPTGERELEGRTVPVFDEIAIFEASSTVTLSVLVTAATPDDLAQLQTGFARRGLGVEVLAARLDLCACCSGGRVLQQAGGFAGEQRLLLGAGMQQARDLLDAWAEQQPGGRAWANLHPAVSSSG
ncbi:hypothetical protein OHA21_13790 [Actinoplanes sp. NBC_00393]|uniref:hypothetical protein n=1 Tax=Actinoplanes sp. NBC_00393 TaxID=2975953 RepID=UPI002E1BAD11